MYRKYVRKWWLLKRNRTICPEIAVNRVKYIFAWTIQIFVKLPRNRNLLEIYLEKSNFCVKLPGKNRNFSEICLEKAKFLWNVKLPDEKSKFFGSFFRKSKFFVKLPKKSKFFVNFPRKSKFCVKWSVKNWHFSEICPEKSTFCLWNCLKKSKFFGHFPRKSEFFHPDPRPPDFKPDWRCWTVEPTDQSLQNLNMTLCMDALVF